MFYDKLINVLWKKYWATGHSDTYAVSCAVKQTAGWCLVKVCMLFGVISSWYHSTSGHPVLSCTYTSHIWYNQSQSQSLEMKTATAVIGWGQLLLRPKSKTKVLDWSLVLDQTWPLI